MTPVHTLVLFALSVAAEDRVAGTETDAPQNLGTVEMGSAYAGELREASFTFVSKQGDLIDARIAVDEREHVAKKLTVSYRKATVAIAPKLLKCIPNPDPRSIVLVLGYVDPELRNRESIAYVDIALEWYQVKPGEAGVGESVASAFSAHILGGEVVWAYVSLPGEKLIMLKPDGSDCDFLRDL